MRISKPSGPVLSQLRKATISTREGFGSFHCEDVETLIRQKDEEYQQPNFVVLVGDFKSKLEAFESLKKIQVEFPNSFIVKEKIRAK